MAVQFHRDIVSRDFKSKKVKHTNDCWNKGVISMTKARIYKERIKGDSYYTM